MIRQTLFSFEKMMLFSKLMPDSIRTPASSEEEPP